MEFEKGKAKKNLIIKTWERWRSFHHHRGGGDKSLRRSRPWLCTQKAAEEQEEQRTKTQVAPQGCFSVYVGPERQRFVMKAMQANHPLFKKLLEDAELEYGFNSEGPIWLPCGVDLFYRVLAEMDSEDNDSGCGFGSGGCSPFNPWPRLGNSGMSKGYGSYYLLTSSPLLKMN